MKYQKNVIKTDIFSYRAYWRGVKKIGKSTLFRDVVKEMYGDTKYGLLISTGNETGFKALSDVVAVEAGTWDEFVEYVDDLVENKGENEFKVVAIDTVDELVAIAGDKVMQIHFRRKGERAETLNSALGGYGAGARMVGELINDQITRIEKAGYGLVFIGHTSIRNIKEKNMEEGYQQLTSNLESRYDSIFSDKADLIATMYIDRDVKEGHLESTQRYIYFRADGFVDAGSRFVNMPERVTMTAKDYIAAIEQGIRNSFTTPVSEEEIEKMRKAEVIENEQKAQEYIAKQKEEKEGNENLVTPEDFHSAIDLALKELSADAKKEKKEELTKQGINPSFKKIGDVDTLKKFLEIVLAS